MTNLINKIIEVYPEYQDKISIYDGSNQDKEVLNKAEDNTETKFVKNGLNDGKTIEMIHGDSSWLSNYKELHKDITNDEDKSLPRESE